MSDDRAMNLSQHAARTGYSREQLALFRPLLIGGKIRPSELDRHIYDYRKALLESQSPAAAGLIARSAPAAPEPAADHRMQAILDKFHAPGKTNGPLDAYNALSRSLRDTNESRR